MLVFTNFVKVFSDLFKAEIYEFSKFYLMCFEIILKKKEILGTNVLGHFSFNLICFFFENWLLKVVNFTLKYSLNAIEVTAAKLFILFEIKF